ncbi:MAG TPA: hypothetical protein PLZ51_24880, partial [Aggregatilineales bacterium]|nr:hypothetical protein [Aggregatilineales bacterium]
KTDDQIPFRMHLHSQDILTEYEIKGLLIPEGTGTRVRGISHIFRIDIQATIGIILLAFAWMIFQVLLYRVDAFKYLSIILTMLLGAIVVFWMITWILVFFKGDRFRKLLGGEVSNEKPS